MKRQTFVYVEITHEDHIDAFRCESCQCKITIDSFFNLFHILHREPEVVHVIYDQAITWFRCVSRDSRDTKSKDTSVHNMLWKKASTLISVLRARDNDRNAASVTLVAEGGEDLVRDMKPMKFLP